MASVSTQIIKSNDINEFLNNVIPLQKIMTMIMMMLNIMTITIYIVPCSFDYAFSRI